MNLILKPLLRLLAYLADDAERSDQPEQQSLAAYCADCGGMSLIREVATQRVYCPQCVRSERGRTTRR